MVQTFEQLGIPFPLFAGPVEDAVDYEGTAVCSLCKDRGHCFTLGIGADVVVECPRCGGANGVDADDRVRNCSACEEPLSVGGDNEELRACYTCLRAGRAALTKDTEFGMIRWEDAVRGTTHGVPAPQEPRRVFQAAPGGTLVVGDAAAATAPDDNERWTKMKLNPKWMFELLRTPAYSTWQGESWLFHEKAPMVYLGTWGRKEFCEHARDGNGERLFNEVVDAAPAGSWSGWLGEDRTAHGISVYVFRAQDGGSIKAHYDMD